jgi:thiol-disulfide isomerase/thioredoxin
MTVLKYLHSFSLRFNEKKNMYKGILILFLLLVSSKWLQAQQIEIQIDGITSGKAYLHELIGEQTVLKDSIPVTKNWMFRFSLGSSNYHIGFYRLTFGQNKQLDFLNDGKEIIIKTNAKNVLDSMQVIKSESNRLYYNFVKFNKLYKTKTDLLQLILARYPKDDEYYQETKNRLASLQKEYAEFVNTTSLNKLSPFVARYIRSAQLPIIPLDLSSERQLDYLKGHALDKVNFTDYQLIYSDVFVNTAIEYLTYYRNPQLPKELLEKEFMFAVDTLLNKARVNQIVYQHLVEYLIDGFKKFGFDKILDYIVENYVIKDDLCLDVKTEGLIKRRIDQAKILKISAITPNFIIPDSSGKNIELYKIKASKVLLVFYASWCPHCKELLPKLKELKNIVVVAASLDTSRVDWLNFVKDNSLKYLNVSDQKGWDGKAAGDYFIYATPTMFLLDSNKKIIGKPINYDEIKSFVN